jgi:hypothetical protein
MSQAPSRFFWTAGFDGTWIEKLLQDELPHLHASLWPNEHADVCPLMDMGEYCLRIIHLLVHFLERPVLNDKLRSHVTTKIGHLANRDDGSATIYLEDKQEALR